MTWIVCKATTGEDGITTVTASTPTSDRYGDVVSAPWALDRYRANPVVVWAHDYSTPPVGRAVDVRLEGPNLIAKIQWDDSPSNPLGQTVAHQFRSGFLSAVSVGFQPGNAVKRSSLDPEHPHHAERGNVYRDNELLEISAVPIPANPDALARRSVSPWMQKHILAVEETDEGIAVLYAKGEAPEEPETEAPEAEAPAPEAEESQGYSEKDDEDDRRRAVRDHMIDLIRGDAGVQAALEGVIEVRKEAACGISLIDDLFGLSD